MTIQEAIKSGKPFKLPHHDDYIIIRLANGKPYFFQEVTGTAIGFFAADLITSNSWEVRDLPDNVIRGEFGKGRKKVVIPPPIPPGAPS